MLERLADVGDDDQAVEISRRFATEGCHLRRSGRGADVYHRISDYSSLDAPYKPEYTLLRDDRDGMPRRIVFDSVTVPTEDGDVQLVGREEPFRALRTHEFALGFDSADLVLEEVVQLRDEPLTAIHEINDRSIRWTPTYGS